MKLRIILLAVALTTALVTSSGALAYNLEQSVQHQQTQINIDANNLGSPHQLEIQITGAIQFSGHLSINSTIIRRLDSYAEPIDLSPFLSTGKNVVEVVGRYRPIGASTQITFSSPDSTIIQQSSGTGQLNYSLILIVQ